MLLLSPGPGICDPDVLSTLAQPCIHHRSQEFKIVYQGIVQEMKQLLHAAHSEIIIMSGSGSYGMEGAILNLLKKGDRVLSIRCGYFGNRFYQMARRHSCTMYSLQYPDYETYDIDDVKWMLEQYSLDAVLVTHCETETGALQDLKSLGKLCRQYDTLLIVDSISGAVMNEVNMDDWHIDCLIMASQKGFLMPPGLCMTALSQKAVKKMKQVQVYSYIFDYKTILQKYYDDARIHSTPNVPYYRALLLALKKLNAKGSQILAAYYHDLHESAKEVLISMGFTILSQGHESNSLIVCKTLDTMSASYIQRELEKQKIRIETGLQDKEDRILRIGIMNGIEKQHLDRLRNALRGILHET